jgi:hypothetical protein
MWTTVLGDVTLADFDDAKLGSLQLKLRAV